MKKALILIVLLLVMVIAGGVGPAHAEPRMTRFYQHHGDFWRAVVQTNKEVRVKCAALDSAGDILAISVPLRVSPPGREIQITVRGATPASGRCWVLGR